MAFNPYLWLFSSQQVTHIVPSLTEIFYHVDIVPTSPFNYFMVAVRALFIKERTMTDIV